MSNQKHIIAVIGGGVSGSEAAFQLSNHGISSVVFEKNTLPYGKIEEGLPKWHVKLRDQEEAKIDDKLQSPQIHFVPNTRLGADISLGQLQEWGFSAVILATGAGQDRRLPIKGMDQFAGQGLYYQNALVSWYNHCHEPGYLGPQLTLQDNALVVGGGLASLDVVKILMLETTLQALRKQNIEIDLFTLEREGLPLILKQHNLTLEKLGLKGCTLCYRRRIIDMPLVPMPENADETRKEKVYQLRKRILDNFLQKYLFRVRESLLPVEPIVEAHRLNGLVFIQNTLRDGNWKPEPEQRIRLKSPLVISSIGSIPEKISELPLAGEILEIEDPVSGKIRGYTNIFALGNVVTGRGNIRESLLHSRTVTRKLINEYLDPVESEYNQWIQQDKETAGGTVTHVVNQLTEDMLPDPDTRRRIWELVTHLQRQAGYHGDYMKWITDHKPVRLEDL